MEPTRITASTAAEPSALPSPSQTPITLRAPSTTTAASSQSPTFTAPTIPWLTGTWHVTHSTLPMWKKARNVAITYKPLPPTSTGTQRLDDLVEYQALSGDKIKTVSGTDTAADAGLAAWDWRGNGWLKIASSHWEVLGFGERDDGRDVWVVTFFAKTLFTPAGIDVYSRRREGLSSGTLEEIKAALAASDAEVVRKLAGEVFVVKSDHY